MDLAINPYESDHVKPPSLDESGLATFPSSPPQRESTLPREPRPLGAPVETLDRTCPKCRESFPPEATPDPLAGEQTWPTDEEVAAGDAAARSAIDEQHAASFVKRRLPAGVSDYQAAWIPDDISDGEAAAEGEEEGEDDDEEAGAMKAEAEGEEEEEGGRLAIEGKPDGMGWGREGTDEVPDDADDNASMRAPTEDTGPTEEDRRRLVEMARDEVEFPDEYRGLKSFRTSPWDPKESLPREYASIYQFANLSHTMKRALGECSPNRRLTFAAPAQEAATGAMALDAPAPPVSASVAEAHGEPLSNLGADVCVFCMAWLSGASGEVRGAAQRTLQLLHPVGDDDHPRPYPGRPGHYVCLHLQGFPAAKHAEWQAAQAAGKGLVVVACGMLRYEQCVSVGHFLVTKHPTFADPVQSKVRYPLLPSTFPPAAIGPVADPMCLGGCSPGWLQDTLIFHAGWRRLLCNPIFSAFSSACAKGKYERFLQPDRLTLASIYAPIMYGPAPLLIFRNDATPPRILLTGYPVKIHKRTAVVRYMFFNPEDIRWFKPVELWTKHGRSGRIKEPIGTHGHMKAVFDSPLTQADTVCMSLYKRIFPKWHTTRVLTTPTASTPLVPLAGRRAKKTRFLTARGEKTGGAPTPASRNPQGFAPR
ncbi:putative Pre-rRNA-processing protein TSR1 [Paratrimastix pyriformis]|uniref:Pre-rRNA-processing protein TSR1 n=1 Tax=Paratrimastix pyriformis TaxID=342808 RepID=A0ABQ8UDH2_9EUKA|nr:putative Pre-rRNA-processing protein TSR1 [Paratrimastix pyriformis]